MNRVVRSLVFLGMVAAVACLACWLTGHYMRSTLQTQSGDAHAWIHTQLGITPEQDKALAPIEERYEEQKKQFNEMLRVANIELARAIREDRSDSDRVKAAVAKIHHAQGELQNATLQHIFEMKAVLTETQYEKLLKATADALTTAEHGR
jgi:nickel and cobalt resistance protein CnrR